MDSDERFEKWMKKHQKVQKASISDIINDPESYDGKEVLVSANVSRKIDSNDKTHCTYFMLSSGENDRVMGYSSQGFTSYTADPARAFTDSGDHLTIKGVFKHDGDYISIVDLFNHSIADDIYGETKSDIGKYVGFTVPKSPDED